MRILIADDEVTSRLLLEETLQEWGYTVEVSADGAEALDVLNGDDPPRLAVLDWMMPGRPGTEVCRAIKAQHGKPYTYIILLTSKSAKEDMVEGFEAGADDYLSKPVDLNELRSRLGVGRRILNYDVALADKNEQLQTLINAMPDLVCFKDGEGRILEINAAFCDLLRLEAKDCIGETEEALGARRPEFADEFKLHKELDAASWDTGEPQTTEEQITIPDKEPRVFSAVRVPVSEPDGSRHGLLYLARDITEQKALEERLREEATYDALTGLANRRHFTECLLTAISAATRYNLPLSLCICDIDTFKEINDTYGHAAGDKVLTQFAEVIRSQIRTPDVPGRIGGDEFCIVFPNTPGEGALKAVERIRRRVEGLTFDSEGKGSFTISASFGLAEVDRPDLTVEAFLERADEALYEAKRAGRNQTHLAEYRTERDMSAAGQT